MGAPNGNTNGQIGEKPMDGHLNMRCMRADKGRWNQAAKRDGFPNMSAWINHTLNAAAKRGAE